MSKPQIGAQVYTARDACGSPSEYAAVLRKIGEIGYAGVELTLFPGVSAEDHRKFADDAGVKIAGAHRDWNQFLTDTDTIIADNKIWDCPHVGIGGLPGEYRRPEGIKRLLDELPPVAEKLAAAGIDFYYHNHSHEFVRCGETTWLATLYEQADPRHLKAQLDTYWVQAGGGDPAEWIRKCAGRGPLLHVKDMAISPDREQLFAEVGEGNLNWPAIIEAAEQSGVEWYLVEQDLCYDRDPLESLAISFRNLREMCGA